MKRKDMAIKLLTVKITLPNGSKTDRGDHHVLLGRHAITVLADHTRNTVSLVATGIGGTE
jgi:hypothetical protein